MLAAIVGARMQWYEWIGLISAIFGFPANAWAIYQIYERFSSKDEEFDFGHELSLLDERGILLEGTMKLLRKHNGVLLVKRIQEDPSAAIRQARITGSFMLVGTVMMLGAAVAPFVYFAWLYYFDHRSFVVLGEFGKFGASFLTLWTLSFSFAGVTYLGWTLDQYRGMRLAQRYIRYLDRGGRPIG